MTRTRPNNSGIEPPRRATFCCEETENEYVGEALSLAFNAVESPLAVDATGISALTR